MKIVAAFMYVILWPMVCQAGSGKVSYHIYGTSALSVSCQTYYGKTPWKYITATTTGYACGTCVKITSKMTGAGTFDGKFAYVTVVDTGGVNFDVNEPAFMEIFGTPGYNAGHGNAEWEKVDCSYCSSDTTGGCPGSGGGGGGTGTTTTRCGASWVDANSNCYSDCTTTCSGTNSCFANLAACSGTSTSSPTKKPTGSSSTSSPTKKPTGSSSTSSPTKKPTPSPTPSGGGGTGTTTTRCGASWGDANSNCYNDCTNDNGCSGTKKCFADLTTACSGTSTSAPTTLSPTKKPTSSPTSGGGTSAPTTLSPTKKPTSSPTSGGGKTCCMGTESAYLQNPNSDWDKWCTEANAGTSTRCDLGIGGTYCATGFCALRIDRKNYTGTNNKTYIDDNGSPSIRGGNNSIIAVLFMFFICIISNASA